jgi:hypothetical protein
MKLTPMLGSLIAAPIVMAALPATADGTDHSGSGTGGGVAGMHAAMEQQGGLWGWHMSAGGILMIVLVVAAIVAAAVLVRYLRHPGDERVTDNRSDSAQAGK